MTTNDDLPTRASLDWRAPWLPAGRPARSGDAAGPAAATRFAFYGRVSTEDQQDPEASREWQSSLARALIAPKGGRLVAEFFDVGQSRALPWKRRPRAAELLALLARPVTLRGFEAVVIGEPQRAFYGNQFGNTFPLFVHYGVQLWVPEVGGPIDPDNEAHDMIMSVFGGMSKGERNRIKIRVRSAMTTQTLHEGRYLGGRPPYGYRLADLGPHPNPGKAADGKRLHGLEPDPAAAPVVARIFREYLAGTGIYAIAEGLTREGIPCPSAHDPARNPHRSGVAWSKGAVRVILTNPRYTGRQVWNKQRKDETLLDIHDVTLGYTTTMAWNTREKWIVSEKIAHTPLVDDATFTAAQQKLTARARTQRAISHARRSTRRPYLFSGLLHCGLCERKMAAQHSRDDPYYRCRFPEEYALANRVAHPRNVYLRETWLTRPLDTWLARIFAPHRLAETIDHLAASTATEPPAADAAVRERARAVIEDCTAKLARHRAALEAGADPAIVTAWIAETQATRQAAEAQLHAPAAPSDAPLNRDQIGALVHHYADLAATLADAAPADRAKLYKSLGLRMTYDPGKHEVRVEVDLDPHSLAPTAGEMVRVRGGT